MLKKLTLSSPGTVELLIDDAASLTTPDGLRVVSTLQVDDLICQGGLLYSITAIEDA